MIFEAEPQQITSLDSTGFVRLIQMLLWAEARRAQIPLRATHVPLQITVSDGGEDARVEWSGGAEFTSYLPRRYSIFQAKAQNITESSVRSEVLKPVAVAATRTRKRPVKRKKASLAKRRKGARSASVLSPALSSVLARNGAYTILSSAKFTGKKREKLRAAIAQAVRDGGGDPDSIVIEVLDANKIAEWANEHPPVALWLAQHARRRSLAGFQTHESWGKSPNIRAAPWVAGTTPRFVAVNVAAPESSPAAPKDTVWTFDEAAAAVSGRLEGDQQCVRLTGPSGFGKSRFAYEVFNRRARLADVVDNATMIYADYSVVGDEVPKLALEIAEAGSDTILVVDECPDEVHQKLAAIAQRTDSRLRLLTIDVETRVVAADNTLTIRLEQASKELLSEIVKEINPETETSNVNLIASLAEGFPQMAVLAAKQKAGSKHAILSAEQYVDRIVWGRRQSDPEAERALSTLSLFEWVGIAGRVSGQAALIAEQLAHMPLDTFVEHIKSFKTRGIIVQRGDFVQVQPLPLAVRLATRRLGLLADGKLFSFFKDAPAEIRGSLLKRLRWLDTTPEARALAASLLAPEALGSLEALNTEHGAELLDRLVHVDPDLAMATIDRVFSPLSIEALTEQLERARRHLVWALQKLVFRSGTFERAARLLRRLGAAEIEQRIANNASGQFKELFHLYLSGTEADPSRRLTILDEGLNSQHAGERELCIDALGEMLEHGHFSRSGGSEEIGSAEPLEDWQPKTYGEIRDFFRAAISRLMAIALSADPFALKAKRILGSHIRGLLGQLPLDEVKSMIDAVVAHDGFWYDAIQDVNEWLFFDRNEAPPDIRQEIRAYFDQLLPTDPVQLAVMYCHGWQTDLHDPDTTYDREERAGRHDFEYSMRKAVELADVIARDPDALTRVIQACAVGDLNNVYPFARRLGELSADPLALFREALTYAEASDQPPNRQFFAGIIAAADTKDPDTARECLQAALRSDKLKADAASFIGASKLRPDDLKLVASLLRSGDLEPLQSGPLSYGRMEHLRPNEIEPFIDELMRHASTGLWVALDVILMYLYPDKAPGPLLEAKLKEILLSPQLFRKVNRRASDGYHLEKAVALLAKHELLNGSIVAQLSKALFALSAVEQSDVFFELDGPVRKIMRKLLPIFPREVWVEAAPILLAEDALNLYRMDRLLDPERDDRMGPGLLFALPAELYLEWAREDPARRAGKVAGWLPVAEKQADGSLAWHPAIDSFIYEFGDQPAVLDEIAVRILPSSWWGSMVPHLEPWLPLLKSWLNHPKALIRTFAQRQIDHLEKMIAAEKKRDEENEVRF